MQLLAARCSTTVLCWTTRWHGWKARVPPACRPAIGHWREALTAEAVLAAGDSNKPISRALDRSRHTVKRHVANILDKLGLDSRDQAAAW